MSTKSLSVEELTELKTRIEKGKNRLAELQGQKTSQMETLKEEFGCSSLAAAEKKITELEKELETLEVRIEDKSAELQEQYPSLFEV